MTDRQSEHQRPEAGKQQGLSRLRLVFLAGAICWALLVGRLVQVQAIQHSSYAQKAEQQHDRWVDLAARRGRIFDREGRILAQDVPGDLLLLPPVRGSAAAGACPAFRRKKQAVGRRRSSRR